MKKEDLGKHFIKDNVVYEAIGYTDMPTMELINRETGNRLSVVIDSDYANEFELVPEDNKIEKLENLNTDYYYENNSSGGISNEEIILDIKTLKNYINKLVDKVNGEDNEKL